MSARGRATTLATVLVSAIVVACGATGEAPAILGSATPSSGPSDAAAATPAPSAPPRASATANESAPGEIRVPLAPGMSVANADSEALIVTHLRADGKATLVEAIDLRTRAVSAVHETVGAAVTVPSIRDGVATLLENEDTSVPMQVRVRVLAGRWRDPASFVQLDEFTYGLAGGDGWSPYPYPQTNGWEVAWLHTTPQRTFEVRLREADGRIRTVYSSSTPVSFALGRTGAVAMGEIGAASPTAPVALRLHEDGVTRTLLERPAGDGGGYVSWLLGRVLWSNGLALVRPVVSVERIDPATGARDAIVAPAGCWYSGGTDAQVAFLCGDHVELSGGSGPSRVVPPIPLLHARAVVRMVPGPPPVAYVSAVTTDDPRPGAGARF